MRKVIGLFLVLGLVVMPFMEGLANIFFPLNWRQFNNFIMLHKRDVLEGSLTLSGALAIACAILYGSRVLSNAIITAAETVQDKQE
jgi:hypothetical protein